MRVNVYEPKFVEMIDRNSTLLRRRVEQILANGLCVLVMTDD